jgi:predicted DNA-binding transcriptional regulator YafY
LPADISRRADLRAIRVIKCLRLLERSCYSADDLAGHFRVSKRTVYRDLRLLASAGVMLAKRTDDRRFYAPPEAMYSME